MSTDQLRGVALRLTTKQTDRRKNTQVQQAQRCCLQQDQPLPQKNNTVRKHKNEKLPPCLRNVPCGHGQENAYCAVTKATGAECWCFRQGKRSKLAPMKLCLSEDAFLSQSLSFFRRTCPSAGGKACHICSRS